MKRRNKVGQKGFIQGQENAFNGGKQALHICKLQNSLVGNLHELSVSGRSSADHLITYNEDEFQVVHERPFDSIAIFFVAIFSNFPFD